MGDKVGIIGVAESTVGLRYAAIGMWAQRPDVSTTIGRLLLAGALSNVCLAFTLFVVR